MPLLLILFAFWAPAAFVVVLVIGFAIEYWWVIALFIVYCLIRHSSKPRRRSHR
jgi:hypothetical protein